MELKDMVDRDPEPKPWSEGDNIPWWEPGFSRRMLKEHLSQEHDAASRRAPSVEEHVEWIHSSILSGRRSRILDLGCGPGLYSTRLAALGHECVGIDYSPASIEHARAKAIEKGLSVEYIQADIREARFPVDQDLVMLIYGEFNVFSPADGKTILRKISKSLSPKGCLVLEVHAPGVIRDIAKDSNSWTAGRSGLWSDSPYICLHEGFWYEEVRSAVHRYLIIDPATGEVDVHSASYQDHSVEEYETLLMRAGFDRIEWHPSLSGTADDLFSVVLAFK